MDKPILDDISVVVLTLKDSHRLDNGIHTYPKCFPPYEVFYGIQPGDPDAEPPGWYLDWKPTYKGRIRTATYCCYISKVKLFKEFNDNNKDNKHLLFLEDDVAFLRNFEQLYNGFMRIVPDDWDIISFGGHHVKVPKEVEPGVLKVECMWGSECVLLNAKSLSRIVDKLSDLRTINTHSDMALLSSNMGNVYAPLTPFTNQKSGYSHIVNTFRYHGNSKSFRYIDIKGNEVQATGSLIYRYL